MQNSSDRDLVQHLRQNLLGSDVQCLGVWELLQLWERVDDQFNEVELELNLRTLSR